MRPAHYGKWGQRGVLKQERQVKGHCRWCGDEIPKGTRRTSYCSAQCYHDCWLRISWSTMRNHITKRDERCRLCGNHSYKALHRYGYELVSAPVYDGGRMIKEGQYARFTAIEVDWHVDHIKPVIEGGTDDPENLRLLCGQCHKRITREWHGERAAKRRQSLPHTQELQL